VLLGVVTCWKLQQLLPSSQALLLLLLLLLRMLLHVADVSAGRWLQNLIKRCYVHKRSFSAAHAEARHAVWGS
jgi:hypothetical protein